jgi:hypothetical protein
MKAATKHMTWWILRWVDSLETWAKGIFPGSLFVMLVRQTQWILS